MIRKVILNIFAILILFSIVGCGLSSVVPDNQEITVVEPSLVEGEDLLEEETSTGPQAGGELKIPIIKPDRMHPFTTRSKDVLNFLGIIYEGLFTYGEDLKPEPVLVDSYEVFDEGKRWEFQLRKGVTWHNGKELTAQDVKYTFDLLLYQMGAMEEGVSIYGRGLSRDFKTARMELLLNNPQGFAIILDEPVGISLLEGLIFPILPRNGELEQVDLEDIDEEIHGDVEAEDVTIEDIGIPIGTGPYKVEAMSQEIGEDIRLIRNDTWWGAEKPYIDSIVARIYKDNEEALEAFRVGDVDLVNTHIIFTESYYMGKDSQLYRYLTHNFDYIGVNYRKSGILQDKLIRRAIAYGIDRKDIISRVYANNAQGVDSPIPPDAWYDDPELRIYDYQPIKAESLLKENGWIEINEDGYLEKDGVELQFTITGHSDNVMQKETLNLIAEQLKDIGIRVETNLLPWEEYLEAIEEREFEAIIGEYYLETLPDLGAMLYSPGSGEGLENYWAYSNDELDKLIDNIPTLEDSNEYKENYRQIQELLVEELPIISLYYKTSSLVTNEKINGIENPRELMIYRNIDEWFFASSIPKQ